MLLALLIALAILVPALLVGIECVGYRVLGRNGFDEFKWSEYRDEEWR